MKDAGRIDEWTEIYWKTHVDILMLKDKEILIKYF